MRVLVLILIISVHSCASSGWKGLSMFNRSLIESRLKVLNWETSNSSAKVLTTEFYVNILQYVCNTDLSTKNISDGCFEQMDVVCENGDLWNLMADAWSKYPYAGMLTATKRDWGAFDQCINIDHVPKEGPRILGKHCTYGLAIPASFPSIEEVYLLSYCVPDSCSAEDVAKLITVDHSLLPLVKQFVNEEVCQTQETNSTLDGSSIAVATIFCFFLTVIVISTIYEIYLHQMSIRNRAPLLTAFSLFTNSKKLTQITHTNSGEQIMVFHGIKVISMMWIVAGHAAGAFSELPVTDSEKVGQIEYQRYMQYLATAHLGVDTFFFISGFLLAYGYFKSLAQKPIIVQIKGIPHMIIHRYLRITPVVLMFFLYSVYLSQYIGSGPLFTFIYNYFNTPCKKHWGAVFLYIQNYYNPTDICWVHLWYLSADWQLFLISPLILIPMAWQYKMHFKRVMIGLIILNIVFFFLPIAIKLGFPDFDKEDLEYDTHSKLVTYFMGVLFGFYLRCRKDEKYIFKNINLFMWCLTIIIMFAATTLYHEMNINEYSHTVKSIAEVAVKPFWCLGLAFITYSCINGYGGIVNWALTAGWIQVISKLTFCLYIMHMPMIFMWYSTRRTREHFSDFNLFFYWCGHFLISTIAAAIWSLSFESPLITIEKILLRGGERRRGGKGEHPPNKEEKYSNGISIVHKPPNESNNGV
ncbi:nose resistant to fluoxetine protein 6-like [Euwallacea fornicatus]|uniref:nose resistant to fluoxetine protein 6-like n=1 Tax=Euwallacea fornicatus TaxID=995702 RepID=UPI00338FCD06